MLRRAAAGRRHRRTPSSIRALGALQRQFVAQQDRTIGLGAAAHRLLDIGRRGGVKAAQQVGQFASSSAAIDIVRSAISVSGRSSHCQRGSPSSRQHSEA